jgi:hypothetical protein
VGHVQIKQHQTVHYRLIVFGAQILKTAVYVLMDIVSKQGTVTQL